MLNNIQKQLDEKERINLSSFACLSKNALRRRVDRVDDYRLSFSIDCDRIIHAKSYTRYIDKTQVFYMINNDHITHRVLHVQLVSKIGRTIGRYLGLNEDLIESIALGHDIGHPPFGHDGEKILAEICSEHGLNTFLHNLQSVRFLDCLEKGGLGLNLSLQTLDGILCHDGEAHADRLIPQVKKSFETFDQENVDKCINPTMHLTPMTLEGCVVRLADTIAYIGRDIEDAIELKIIHRDQLPSEACKHLGTSNGTIVYNLVSDLVRNSYQSDSIGFSSSTSAALQRLKQFNYDNIYLNPQIKKGCKQIRDCYRGLFETFYNHLSQGEEDSSIFIDFVLYMSKDYLGSNSKSTVVCDFIAGMTDDYFINQAKLYNFDISLIKND